MSDRLKGRVAVVTGASRGLGKATALALAGHGAHVAVVARTESVWNEKLPGTIGETVAEIEAKGGTACAIQADLLEPGATTRLMAEAKAALGPISILVNNAAFTAPGKPPAPGESPRPSSPKKPVANETKDGRVAWPTFVGTPVSAYRRHFDIGVFAVYELMQLAVPDMIALGGGSIINVTSEAARMPGSGPYPDRSGGVLPGYGGSKAALEHLTQCAAYDLQAEGISVNALSPSVAIMTPGVAYYAADFDEYGKDSDFAEAAVRLALVDASVVTGRVLGHLDVLAGEL